jgi:hypothetical protein
VPQVIQINNVGDLGRSAAQLRRRRQERGRRRTRQDQISLGPQDHSGFKTAGKIADHEIRTERRKPVSSAGPVFERANSLERTIQPFDLMSRRHPLSSMEPPELEFASREANRSEGSKDVPASSRRQFS